MTYDGYADAMDWQEADFGRPSPSEEAFYDHEIASAIKSLGGPVRLVEVGFGNGHLLGWALSKGFEVYGIEIQETLRRRAQALGVTVYESLIRLEPASCDTVIFIDVFEHIPYHSLVELCTEARAVLKPGGVLLARFPNGDSPFGLSVQNSDPTHVTWLGKSKVALLMRASGFQSHQLRAPVEIAFGSLSWAKLTVKRMLRFAFTAYARIAFLGSGGPSTFEINYWLVAGTV